MKVSVRPHKKCLISFRWDYKNLGLLISVGGPKFAISKRNITVPHKTTTVVLIGLGFLMIALMKTRTTSMHYRGMFQNGRR